MARNEAIGFVETFGLAAAVACADAGVKGANVTLLGYEYTKGDGMCTVKFAGNVGAVKSAIEAGKRAADAVNGTLQGTKSVRLMARPADGIKDRAILLLVRGSANNPVGSKRIFITDRDSSSVGRFIPMITARRHTTADCKRRRR